MAGALLAFNDDNFSDEVLKASEPVLVDFWAEWCGPCRMLTPTIEALATKYAGVVKVGKLNTDENNATAASFSITSIPTVLLFKNGVVADKVVGAANGDAFAAMLKKNGIELAGKS